MAQNKIQSATDQRKFTIIYNDFLESNLLNKHEKLIFIALKRFSNNETAQSYPSYKRLHEMTGISIRWIKESLQHMQELGILKIEHRETKVKGHESNLYTLYDFAEIWNVKDDSDNGSVAQKEQIELAKIKALAKKYGYTLIKEKEPASSTDQSKDTELSQNRYKANNDNITGNFKSQAVEHYPLDDIKELIGYDALLDQMPEAEKDIDTFFNLIYDTLNTTKPYIKISGTDKPVEVVRGRLLKLNYEHIAYCIQKYNEQTGKIHNPTAYKLKLLYDSFDQMYSDITNQVMHDFYGEEETDQDPKEQ